MIHCVDNAVAAIVLLLPGVPAKRHCPWATCLTDWLTVLTYSWTLPSPCRSERPNDT